MLHFVVGLVVIVIPFLFVTLLVVKLVNHFQPLHGPVCELPCFTPADIHWFCANNHNHKINSFVTDTCCQAWTGRWRNTGFYSINASLTEHQVRVVPLVSLPVAVRVLLQDVRLGTNRVPKKRDFHGMSTQTRYVQRSCFIIWIS